MTFPRTGYRTLFFLTFSLWTYTCRAGVVVVLSSCFALFDVFSMNLSPVLLS